MNLDDSVSVTCLISSGDQPVDIGWLFNGYHINSFSGISIIKGGKRSSILSIDSASAQHAGNYTCVAKNRAHTSTFSAELVVNGLLCKSIFCLILFLDHLNKLIWFLLFEFPYNVFLR